MSEYKYGEEVEYEFTLLTPADKKAYRFYQRNLFLDFETYMEQERNMEINENIPMYMKL